MPGTTPIVGDFLQIRTTSRAEEQISQNVLHYAVESIVGAGLTLLQIADGFSTSVSALYRAWMPIFAAYEGLSVQNLTPPITDPRESANGAGAGTGTGSLLPRQASGLVSTSTGFGGRANRGRIYVGFMAEQHLAPEGDLKPAGITVLQNVADGLGPTKIITLGGSVVTLRLTVRHPNTLPPVVVPQWTPVTAVTAQGRVATQRRRGDFGPANN